MKAYNIHKIQFKKVLDMYAQAENPKENKSRTAANSVTQKRSNGKLCFGFVDNRSEAIRQRKLQETVNNHAAQQQQPIQKKENNTINNASNTLIQRTPAEWEAAPQIIRMLEHPHGWFSTWKKIKAKIREYIALLPEALDARGAKLDEIRPLIEEWNADEKHTAASTEKRVKDIRTDMPILEYLVTREYTQIERQREQAILDRYYEGGDFAEEVINATPAQILPQEIINGIAALPTPAAKAARLFTNLNAFQFTYTGNWVGTKIAFLAKRGDCQTLRDMYIYAAAHLEISVVPRDRQYDQLVPPGPIHGRNTSGNTENQSHWFFNEHYWVTAAGQDYDLLFKTQGLGPHYQLTDTQTYRDVTYKVFNNGNCLLPFNQTGNLNVDFNSAGLVIANVGLMQAYIDVHHN